jgi:predicted nucleic acid-binding protein
MTDVVVVDNSALIEVVTGKATDRQLIRRLTLSSGCAPEVIDAEALNTLRRLMMRGVLTDEQATGAMSLVADSPIRRFQHRPLLQRAWQLRHSVSGGDALYVSLAEHLGVPLVTCDAKLAGSHGHDVKVELYPTT